MPGRNHEQSTWDQARENIYWRLGEADRKSREQDEVLDDLCDRVTATETSFQVRDARTAWLGWLFGFLGAVLGTVIGGYLLWKLGVHT